MCEGYWNEKHDDRWARGRVGEFGEVRMGRQRSPKHENGPSMMPYLRVANVFDGYIDYSDVLRMNFTPSERAEYTLRAGDILLNEGQALGLVGRSAIYDGPPGEFCYQNTLIRYRCGPELSPGFAQKVFSYWRERGYFASVAFQTTSIAHLGSDRFARMEMSVPPLGEQRRIADVLGSLDSGIQASERLIAKLDAVRLGLVMGLLSRAETCSKDPLAGVSQVDSGITLGSSLIGAGNKYPYLRVANVQDGYLDLSDVKTVKMTAPVAPAYRLRAGDVLMTEGGDFDKLGRGVVWRGEIAGCLYQNHIFRVRCDESVLLPDFLAIYSSSWYGKNYFRLASKQSTNLASINSTQLKAFPVPVAPLEEQHRIVSIVKAHDERIAAERARLEKLRKLKTGLMDDLFTGRVRVDQLQDLPV